MICSNINVKSRCLIIEEVSNEILLVSGVILETEDLPIG